MPHQTRQLHKSFRSLGWKLTLSYTLVTVAALLVVEVTALLLVSTFIRSDLLPRLLIQAMQQDLNPRLSPYLEKDPPDVAELGHFLHVMFANGFSINTGDGNGVQITSSSFSGEGQLLILGPDGSLLASEPEITSIGPGQPFLQDTIPDFTDIISAAQAGEYRIERLFARGPNGDLGIAFPIRNDTGQVLGVLAFTTGLMPFGIPDLWPLLSLVLASLIWFTLAAGVVGTIFGFFTARGFSRRLRRVAEAADSWSRGDFSTFIKDTSPDEIGQLSRRLNFMAVQLQNLLETSQELAAMEERNRLARDLHDSVKQQVFAAAMQVGAARSLLDSDPTRARNHMTEAEQLARQAQTELTGLIRELRPAALAGRGLTGALREYMDRWSRQNGFPVEFLIQGERPVSLPVEQVLFRIAQEALANVARHSQATRCAVHLAWEENCISLAVSDNGQGFDPAAVSGRGVGLQSMRERAEAVQGTLSVKSTPTGTRLSATIPINYKQYTSASSADEEKKTREIFKNEPTHHNPHRR